MLRVLPAMFEPLLCNIAIQLVLRQCCKTGCMFVVARATVALRLYIQYHFTLVTSSYYVYEIY